MGVTRVGRGPKNDLVIQGADAGSVSLEHLEISRDGSQFHIRDLDSTNGTYLNGERVSKPSLSARPPIWIGPHERQDALTTEIRDLMAEFEAEVYSIPSEFEERVGYYIEPYQGPDRPPVKQALGGAAAQIRVMRQVLRQEQLPLDLAYIPLVESALAAKQTSSAGAAGPWQLTPATARACGLRVEQGVDERLNLLKATRASCRYLCELILNSGVGSSVMLALAAYDLGPTKVKQAVVSTVHHPTKQRNFWYLYRINALPKETREYVPKVVAAMIIGRSPQRFGF